MNRPLESTRAKALTSIGVGLAVSLLALRLWWQVARLAVSVPYWDQWDFLDGLFEHRGPLDLFLWQHGPHRQGLGGLLYGWLYPVTAWSAHAEALVAWTAIALAAALALRIRTRLEGAAAPSDALLGFAFFSVSSFELFLGAQNLSHGPLPILLTLVAVGLAAREPTALRSTALALTGAVALFTGFGLVLAPVVAALFVVELVARSSTKATRIGAAVALSALAIVALVFFHGYLWLPASDCLERSGVALGSKLEFLGAMVGRAWGMFGIGAHRLVAARLAAGVAAFLLVAAVAIAAGAKLLRAAASDRARSRAVFVACGFTTLFFALAVPGRYCLGIEAAVASRYTLYAAPGLLGLLLAAPALPRVPRRVAMALLALLLVAKELRSGGDLASARDLHERKTTWVSCYRRTGDLDRCDRKARLAIYPPDRRESSRIAQKLQFLEERKLSLFAGDDGGALLRPTNDLAAATLAAR